MAFVGLFIYTAIGAVFASVALRILSPDTYHPFLAGKRNYNYEFEVWWSLAALTVFWLPIIVLGIPLAIVAGVVFAIVAGPAWVAVKVSKYASKTQMDMKEAA
jgi:hypothetical protein